MPEMGGLEATRKIRESLAPERQPRIIALTAAVLEQDQVACVDAGMDGYLTKPIRPEELLLAIRQSASGSAKV